jgi:hypothetical protein
MQSAVRVKEARQTNVRVFSSEVDAGSRKENAPKS